MLPPKKPKQPIKPLTPPLKVSESITVFLVDYEEKSLQELLDEKFKDIELDAIKIVLEETDYGYGDSDYRMALKYSWIQEDPNWHSKMTKYHSQLEKYEEARRQYKLDVEEYKQKLKAWHEEQLKDLTD